MIIERVHSRRYPDSIVFRDVGWPFYRAMLKEFDERPSRINYDRGTLEVMTLSFEHERYKMVLSDLLAMLAVIRGIRVARGGSSTLKRSAKRKGLEADLCFWVANEPAMRAKTRIDLRTDPPPDLVVEIDVMHSAVNRENIYRSLGVPEMWVLTPKAGLSAFRLHQRKWEPLEHSLSFPFLRVADLNPFVARIGVDDDTSVVADFADWLRRPRA